MKALSAAFVIASLLLVGMLGAEINEVTIYDIQYTTDPSGTSPLLGDTVITYGIVTGIFGNSFFIEERPGGPWHGIYVYRGYQGSPAVSEGDSVRVLGIVSEYHNLTEIGANYYGEVEIIASGLSLPDTTEITVAQMWSEQYEGMLARINTVHFVETGTFSGNHSYHIVSSDGQDTGVVYVKTVTDIPGNPIPTGDVDIVGNMSQYDSHYEILPRKLEDIISSGNYPPVIDQHIRIPYTPPPGVNPYVCVRIEDIDGTVVSDWLYYTPDEWATYDSVLHDSVSGVYYYFTVPGLPYQGKVDYYIKAIDDDGATTESDSFFFLQVEVPPIKINEVLYDAANDGSQGSEPYAEWIEIYNAGDEDFDLSGWMIADDPDFTNPSGSGDGVFTIPSGVTIGAGEYLILAFDADTFNTYWPDHGSAQVVAYGDSPLPLYLGNSGDDIHLFNQMGQEVDVVWIGSGGDMYAWGHAAEDIAAGKSLMRIPDGNDTDYPDVDFFSSDTLGGPTPGTGNNLYICGDINGDGQVSFTDLQYLAQYLFAGGNPPVSMWGADVNGDGQVSFTDLQYLAQYLFAGGPPPNCP